MGVVQMPFQYFLNCGQFTQWRKCSFSLRVDDRGVCVSFRCWCKSIFSISLIWLRKYAGGYGPRVIRQVTTV